MVANVAAMLMTLRVSSSILPQTSALVAAMVPTPSAAQITAINAFYSAAGSILTAKGEWWNFLAAQSQQAAFLDWVNPSRTLTALNAPTFTANSNMQGNGTNSYLLTPINYTTTTKFTQTNASLIMASLAHPAGAGIDLGGVNSTCNVAWASRFSGDLTLGRIGASTNISSAETVGLGQFAITRTGTTQTSYKDGVQIATGTPTNAAFGSTSPTIFRFGASSFSNTPMSLAAWMAFLTPTEIMTLFNASKAYLNFLNPGAYP